MFIVSDSTLQVIYFSRLRLRIIQDTLSHKSIVNTEIYIKMVVLREEEYYYSTAKTLEEFCKLEDGWSFFTEIDGIKVFRKPK
jgi:hypothetical protein